MASSSAQSTSTSLSWDQIVHVYETAQSKKASSWTQTSPRVIDDSSIPFLLKVATVLRDKPTAPTPDAPSTTATTTKKPWKNPFLPPDPDLFVCHLLPPHHTHSLVLNKFNIVPHHALVITRDFVPQEDPLTEADLEATWQVMSVMPGGALAYFNRGSVSGASQPHKHLQVVPLPLNDLNEYKDRDPPFAALIRGATASHPPGPPGVLQLPDVPFACYVARLDVKAGVQESGRTPSNGAGKMLKETYDALVERSQQLHATTSTCTTTFSFNLIMTQDFMMVVPRSAEGLGPVKANAMAYAGSFFVRGEDELEYIEAQGPLHVLTALGYPVAS